MLAYRCRGQNGVLHQDNDDDVGKLRGVADYFIE